MANSLKEKILEKLEQLSEAALVEVLGFVEFLEWRKQKNHQTSVSRNTQYTRTEDDTAWLNSDLSNLGSYDPYDWQPGELEAGLPVKYIAGKGVVIVEE
jgi:hypothetical protein